MAQFLESLFFSPPLPPLAQKGTCEAKLVKNEIVESEPLVWVLRSKTLGEDSQSIAVLRLWDGQCQSRHIAFKSRQRDSQIVHLKSPLAPGKMFDLVICDAYEQGRNIVSTIFPLMRKALPGDKYLATWRDRFKDLPRPWVGLFIGRLVRPFIMPIELALTLAGAR